MLLLAGAKLALVIDVVDREALTESFPAMRAAEQLWVAAAWPWWQFTLVSAAT